MSSPKPFLMKSLVIEEYAYETEEQRSLHVKEMQAAGWEASTQIKSSMWEYGQEILGLTYIGKFSKEVINQHPKYFDSEAQADAVSMMRAFPPSVVKEENDLAAWSAIINPSSANKERGNNSPLAGYSESEARIFPQVRLLVNATPSQRKNLYNTMTPENADTLIASSFDLVESWARVGLLEHHDGMWYPANDVNREFGIKWAYGDKG